jgi:hypothetical protein
MDKQIRTTRENETRTAVERPDRWRPAQLLPTPNPEPGYRFKWIRVSMMGKDDPKNISNSFAEGWEPVKLSMHPEVKLFSFGESRIPDSIEVGGLLLCKIPEEFMEQRSAHYQNVAEQAMQSVDNDYMKQNDPRMPVFRERQSSSTFGRR